MPNRLKRIARPAGSLRASAISLTQSEIPPGA